MHEDFAIRRLRSAVDIQHRRIGFRRIKIDWFQHPAVNPHAVVGEADLLRLSDIGLREHGVVDMRQLDFHAVFQFIQLLQPHFAHRTHHDPAVLHVEEIDGAFRRR